MDYETMENIIMSSMSKKLGVDIKVVKEDFAKFNKAIDDLKDSANISEDDAVAEIAKSWEFSGLF